MNKNVWIGSALGLLFLAVVGAGWWVWQGGNPAAVVGTPAQGSAPLATAPGTSPEATPGLGSPAQRVTGRVDPASSTPAAALNAEARRKRLKQIRAEIAAIQSQGAQASPAQVQALLNELEALSPGQFDPRYFQALRDMLEGSSQIQALNRELQTLSSSNAPADEARKKAILAELQAISARISAAAVNLQTYARRPAAQGGKSP
ncbi:hypothetical protein [Acidovorax sp.]|uniref:hypothetical protein n=1 Tax=Acidovorax sp. TaxID=1872122 RepID=UPI00391B26AA